MSQKAKNFILLVELVERELPASVLVGAELAGRGHNVWLIEKGRFRKSPASFPPSIVLEKGLSKGCLSRFRSIRGAGHVLAVMCQEGFIYRSGEDYIDRRVHAETIDNIDYMFLWGERQKKDLERFLGRVRGYHVTGNPRVDLLHRRFRPSCAARPGRSATGTAILCCSPRASAPSIISAVAWTRRSTGVRSNTPQNAEETVGRAPRASASACSRTYMSTIAEIARRLPEQKFIVRPHPNENVECGGRRSTVANVEICDDGVATSVALRRAMRRAQCAAPPASKPTARQTGDRISSGDRFRAASSIRFSLARSPVPATASTV